MNPNNHPNNHPNNIEQDVIQQQAAQREVVRHEQVATEAVEYSDELVAKQIYGTHNVAQAVQDAEQQALNAVAATE